jgi:hypothetical protein
MKIELHNRLVSEALLPAVRLELCGRLPSFDSNPEEDLPSLQELTDRLMLCCTAPYRNRYPAYRSGVLVSLE